MKKKERNSIEVKIHNSPKGKSVLCCAIKFEHGCHLVDGHKIRLYRGSLQCLPCPPNQNLDTDSINLGLFYFILFIFL